jgi:hypothetical protein
MKIITGIFAFFFFIIVMLALGWVFTGNDFFLYRYFAPKQEAVRREVFEQSKAYRQGGVQELQNMQFEYEQASPDHKAALRSIILHRATDFPTDAMPADLYQFIESLKHSGGLSNNSPQ